MSRASFPDTRHSVIQALGAEPSAERARAFDALARLYWHPIASYVRMRWPRERDNAEDLTQSFFAAALDGNYFARFDPARARFRTFLRLCVDRHVMKQLEQESRRKRGGGVAFIPLDDVEIRAGSPADESAETLFRDEWVRHLFGLAVERLATTLTVRGKRIVYDVFAAYDLVSTNESHDGPTLRPTYQALAARFAIPATQVTNHLNSARRLLREIVIEELSAVSGSDAELRDEARALLGLE